MTTTLGNHELDSLSERIARLINVARIVIVLSLLVFQVIGAYSGIEMKNIHLSNAGFYGWSVMYFLLIIFSVFRPNWQSQSLDMPNASAVVDISMMMILVFISGGLQSGLGILVLPFIATSCLLSYGHYPLLYAGYASLLLIMNLFLETEIGLNLFHWDQSVITTVLFIGASYLVAVLTSFAAKYLKQATESASQHRLAYNRISGLNRLVLERVQEAIVVVDKQQKIWLSNPQAKTYFPDLEVNQPETVLSGLIDRWQQNPNKTFETDINLFEQDLHVRAVPLIQEQIELLMLYVRSVREVEAEALSTKLASLGQLTANLAHEIRNPMSAIRHASDLLQEEEADPFKNKLYNIINSNILRIDKMLEDVSMLNKRNNINREPIPLLQFWQDFEQEFLLNNPSAAGCLHLKTELSTSDLTVLSDPMHLQQILWNLCNNAWRHSRHDEQAVTLWIRPSGRRHLSLVVADNGEGVAPSMLNHLFEPFFTTEKQGTGLGLYVARELAHANRGQLQHVPEMNGFELILPKGTHD